jgi:signal transduction histidine kinase
MSANYFSNIERVQNHINSCDVNEGSSVLKLLLLEDNPGDAALIQDILRRAGLTFMISIVDDKIDFLQRLQDQKFDVVLADNALPQYSSTEALQEVRSSDPYIAFILVTGSLSEDFAAGILKQGADDYILKTNLIRLPSAIKNAIARRQNEKSRIELNSELRRISAHMEEIREKEQRRIAREVHDQLGGLLTGLKLDVGRLKAQTEDTINNRDIQDTLSEISQLLDEAVVTVRRVALDIRPSVLDDLGINEALEWKSREFSLRSGIVVRFSGSSQPIIAGTQTGTALFRIYQEVLTNAARHANADLIITKLEKLNNSIRLTVTDNGTGFDSTLTFKSLGLLSMKERAYMVGGVMDIKSKPGTGTTIIVNVPLDPSLNNLHHV